MTTKKRIFIKIYTFTADSFTQPLKIKRSPNFMQFNIFIFIFDYEIKDLGYRLYMMPIYVYYVSFNQFDCSL